MLPVLEEMKKSPAFEHLGGTANMATAAIAGMTAGLYAMKRAADVVFAKISEQFFELDKIGDTAETIGMSASALGKMATMATMADVSVESLTGGLEKMMVTVGKAAGGDEEAKGPLGKLGLDARKLAAMAPEKQLNVIAAEIAKLPSRAERLAVISEVFGKGNREIIKFIENFDELRAAVNAPETSSPTTNTKRSMKPIVRTKN